MRTLRRTLDLRFAFGACMVLMGCAPTGSSTGSIPGAVAVAGAGGPRRDAILREEPGVDAVFAQGIAQVWSVLPDVFARLEIRPTVVDAAGRHMGNDGFGARTIEGRRLSTYLDCGSGPWGRSADTYEVQVMMHINLLPAPDGGTIARTTVDAFAAPRSVSATGVRCRSLGTLEQRVGDLIGERLR